MSKIDKGISDSVNRIQQFDVRFLAVWPCPLNIDRIELSQRIEKEEWVTKMSLFASDQINIAFEELGVLSFRDAACAEISSKIIFIGSQESLFESYAIKIKNSQNLITKYLKLINAVILKLKYVYSQNQSSLIRLRNIGVLDLTTHNLIINNCGVYLRSNDIGTGRKKLSNKIFEKREFNVEEQVKKEWALLTKASDLVNIGFPDEGLIVSFALLDYEVQNFVRKKLHFLTSEEIEMVLRGVEKKRLEIYLGPLLKIIQKHSPLDDLQIKTDLKWLNSKRNEIMHNGKFCTTDDVVRGIKIVISILAKLNEMGSELDLPNGKLIFWV